MDPSCCLATEIICNAETGWIQVHSDRHYERNQVLNMNACQHVQVQNQDIGTTVYLFEKHSFYNSFYTPNAIINWVDLIQPKSVDWIVGFPHAASWTAVSLNNSAVWWSMLRTWRLSCHKLDPFWRSSILSPLFVICYLARVKRGLKKILSCHEGGFAEAQRCFGTLTRLPLRCQQANITSSIG